MKKFVQLTISVILIFLAFQKIDIRKLLLSLLDVPLALVIFTIVYSFISTTLSSWRWGIILLKKPSWQDIVFLVRCNYLALFYSLFLPSSMSGDLFRWLPLMKRYPGMGKLKIAGSVLIDRIVGASALFPVALVASLLGKMLNFNFPEYLIAVFGFGCVAIASFYLVLSYIDFEKLPNGNKFSRGLIKTLALIRNEEKTLLLKVFCVSISVQLVGLFPMWVRSQFLGAGFSLLSVYIFIPVISLALLLPVSIAGFGAREQLFLFFYSQIGVTAQKILLVSTFSGLANILFALMGGLLLIPPLLRKDPASKEKSTQMVQSS